jgi:hypothetical protein
LRAKRVRIARRLIAPIAIACVLVIMYELTKHRRMQALLRAEHVYAETHNGAAFTCNSGFRSRRQLGLLEITQNGYLVVDIFDWMRVTASRCCCFRKCIPCWQRRSWHAANWDFATDGERINPARAVSRQLKSVLGYTDERPWQQMNHVPPADGRERLRALAVLG